jgi:hypothetical protein
MRRGHDGCPVVHDFRRLPLTGDADCLSLRLGKMGKDQPFLIHGFYRDRELPVDNVSTVDADSAHRQESADRD